MPAIPVLIKALKYVRNVRSDDGFAYRDFSAAEAAAKVLGSFGPDAKAAVPALIEAAQSRDKNDDNWWCPPGRDAGPGADGPDAKTAIPILEKIVEDDREPSCRAEAIAALISWPQMEGKLPKSGLKSPRGTAATGMFSRSGWAGLAK